MPNGKTKGHERNRGRKVRAADRLSPGSPVPWFLLLGLTCLAVARPEPAPGQEYQIALEAENRVRFLSDAPLEDFEGVTNRIDGFLYLPGEGLGKAVDLDASEFYFEVDLASLDTGIGLRNRHMRNNYLETRRFPFASFEGRLVSLEQEGSGRSYRALARGRLSIHGVSREREIACRGTEDATGRLEVRCRFQVTLSDHEIPIPKLMFMKINEVMELEVDIRLEPVSRGRAGGGGTSSPGGGHAQ